MEIIDKYELPIEIGRCYWLQCNMYTTNGICV